MRIGIIGLGNMGTALANLIAGNGHRVLGWEIDATVVDEINRDQTSSRYLTGIRLHRNLDATSRLADVITGCQVIFMTLPSRFIERTLTPLLAQVPPDTVIVNVAKGIDAGSGITAFGLVSRLLPANPRVHLSGPSIANEYAQGKPTAVMIASDTPAALATVSVLLDNAHFRTRHSSDPIGVELGGVLKNIYALGLGLLTASGADNINFKGVYLTMALQEMQALGVALGAQPESFLGIAGIGDLIATALSEHSHNARMGRLLANGKSVARIERELGTLPEGYYTLLAALALARQHGITLPLAEGLHGIIGESQPPAGLVQAILQG